MLLMIYGVDVCVAFSYCFVIFCDVVDFVYVSLDFSDVVVIVF